VKRLLLITATFVCASAMPAFAHTSFTPDEAGPGTLVRTTLHAADERDDATITQVELFFPEGVLIPAGELVSGPGWTGTVFPERILWTGGTADGDQEFQMTLGPLPDQPGRLQFRVLQTYSNGDVDRWIQEWPAGAAEPDMPGPVIDLVPGAPGTVPTLPPTVAPTTATTTSTVATTTTDAGDAATAQDADGEDGGTSAAAVAGIVIAAIVVVGVAAWLILRARRR
jgi:uncharacterized protein YcnI